MEQMRILSDGKVGIGTTNPEFALHVKEPTAGTGVFNPTLLLEGGSVGNVNIGTTGCFWVKP